MTEMIYPTLGALILQLALGLAVFQANRHRLANQCFLLLSLTIAGWVAALYFALTAPNTGIAEFFIRQASVAGVLYFAALNLLRLSIRGQQFGWRGVLSRSRIWLLLTVLIAVLCQTRYFLRGAEMPRISGMAPSPLYGPGVNIYAAYFVVAFAALIVFYWRDLRKTTGGERAELAFILIGAVSGVALALVLAFLLDYILGPSRAIWFAPFRVVLISVVIAYGIATRKIMDVGLLLRRLISYTLLTSYLLSLYALVWWLVGEVLRSAQVNQARS